MRGFTSGKVSHDPMPWVNGYGSRFSSPALYLGSVKLENHYSPRPEFDHHNPILVSLRKMVALHPEASLSRRALAYLASVHDMGVAMGLTIEQQNHARRVLTKLAALTPKEA